MVVLEYMFLLVEFRAMELTKKDKQHIEQEVRKLQFRIVVESQEYARLYEKTYLEALKEKIDERIENIEYSAEISMKVSEPTKTE